MLSLLPTLAATNEESILLLDLGVILGAAGLVATLAHRLKLPTIPAYLITGALVGPGTTNVLGFITGEADPTQSVSEIANLAIILLMFGIGMHMDFSAMRAGLGRLVAAGLGAVVLCTLPMWLLAMLITDGWAPALVIAMALSLSSTAVVMAAMQRRRELHRMSGRLSLAILIVQDLAVIAMLMAVPALVAAHNAGRGDSAVVAGVSVGSIVLWGTVAVAGTVIVGRYVVPFLLRHAAGRNTPDEVLTVLCVAFAFAASAATFGAGLSAELGAFLAGFMLSTTTFKHHLSGQVGAIRDLFIAIFFTTLGMQLDAGVLREGWFIVLIAAATVLAVKATVIGFVSWAAGATHAVALKTGLSLSQAGEFTLILLAVAAAGFGPEFSDTVSKMTAVVVLTLIATPPLMTLADVIARRVPSGKLAPWVHTRTLVDADERPVVEVTDPKDERRRHVVVAGFGVVGRTVTDRLCAEGVSVSVIEMNLETVKRYKAMGRSFVFGDASDPEVLSTAGMPDADALVLTIPDDEAATRAVRVAKRINPQARVIVRTPYMSRAMTARAMGADVAVIEEVATAEAMDRLVLEAVGLPYRPQHPTDASLHNHHPGDTPTRREHQPPKVKHQTKASDGEG